MTDFKTYAEGTPFTGKIGRTVSTSEAAWPSAPRARPGAPNVLVFLLDDVGFAQLGCYGSDIHTPNIDRLAAGGLRYRDFHTTAICSPTRASLLTGRNPHSNGVGIIQEMATGFPGYNGSVPKENGFLSEMLLAQGYATFGIGKWHLTPASECAAGATRVRWPLSRGFETFYGFIGGKTSQWVPALVHDNHCIEPPRRPEEGYHLNADLADHAISNLVDLRAVASSKPFFMYYCLAAGHSPHHVEPEWIERYRGKFDKGWDRWREEVFARQLQLGIVPPFDSIENMLNTDFIPDGCAIDAEDHVWVADAKGGRAVRVAPNGEVVQTVKAPDGCGVYACALGGPQGNTLLLCAAPDFSDVNRRAANEAVLYVEEVKVPRGQGLP